MLTPARAAALALACCAASCSKETTAPPAPRTPTIRPVPAVGGMPLAGTDAIAKAHGFTECQASSDLDSLVCKYPKSLLFDETRADFATVRLNINQPGTPASASYSGITFHFDRRADQDKCPKPKARPGDAWADVDGGDCPIDGRLDVALKQLASKGWVSSPREDTLYHPDIGYYARFDRGITQGATPHITIIPLDDDSAAMAQRVLADAAQARIARDNAASLVEKMRSAK